MTILMAIFEAFLPFFGFMAVATCFIFGSWALVQWFRRRGHGEQIDRIAVHIDKIQMRVNQAFWSFTLPHRLRFVLPDFLKMHNELKTIREREMQEEARKKRLAELAGGEDAGPHHQK